MSTKKDIYERLTEQAIAGLTSKGLEWFRPWTNAQGDIELPLNNHSKRYYKGVNVATLTAVMQEMGYEHNEWVTYKQANELKGQVRKGEKGTEVIFWVVGYYIDGKWYSTAQAARKAGHTPKDRDKTFSVRSYRVFNIGQCDSIEPRRKSLKTEETAAREVSRRAVDVLEQYVGAPQVKHGGSSAYYNPRKDVVQMPKVEQFSTSDSYDHTLFHELVHSTGHDTRLARKGVTDKIHFGSESYAQEELIAEMGAQYLCALTGTEAGTASQAYINNWCEKLNSEPRWIVYAASKAEKAVNHILPTGA